MGVGEKSTWKVTMVRVAVGLLFGFGVALSVYYFLAPKPSCELFFLFSFFFLPFFFPLTSPSHIPPQPIYTTASAVTTTMPMEWSDEHPFHYFSFCPSHTPTLLPSFSLLLSLSPSLSLSHSLSTYQRTICIRFSFLSKTTSFTKLRKAVKRWPPSQAQVTHTTISQISHFHTQPHSHTPAVSNVEQLVPQEREKEREVEPPKDPLPPPLPPSSSSLSPSSLLYVPDRLRGELADTAPEKVCVCLIHMPLCVLKYVCVLLCFEMTDVHLVCVKGCKSLCVCLIVYLNRRCVEMRILT